MSSLIAEHLHTLSALYLKYGVHGDLNGVAEELRQLGSLEWWREPRFRVESLVYGWLRLVTLRPGGRRMVSRDELQLGGVYAELVVLSATCEFPTETQGISESGPNISHVDGRLDEAVKIWRWMADMINMEIEPTRRATAAEGKQGYAPGMNPLLDRVRLDLRALMSVSS